jgi:hypothetical protein
MSSISLAAHPCSIASFVNASDIGAGRDDEDLGGETADWDMSITEAGQAQRLYSDCFKLNVQHKRPSHNDMELMKR